MESSSGIRIITAIAEINYTKGSRKTENDYTDRKDDYADEIQNSHRCNLVFFSKICVISVEKLTYAQMMILYEDRMKQHLYVFKVM